MRFCQQLQVWMEQTDCRASELCARAGIAAPSLSRYRSGERTPGRDSAAMNGLCRALAALAQEKGVPGMTEAEVRVGRSTLTTGAPACGRTSTRWWR